MQTGKPLSAAAFKIMPKLAGFLFYTIGAMLLGFAVALLFGNITGHVWVSPADPLFMVSIRMTFSILSALMFVISLVSLFGKSDEIRAFLPLWLASIFWVYQIGLSWNQIHFSGYLGNIADAFGVTPRVTNAILKVGFLYVLLGSMIAWLWVSFCKGRFVHLPREAIPNNTIKMTCPSCETHIDFAVQNLGRDTFCPRCKTMITLQRDITLKMSCFFCKENIEFSAYALGRKIKCPHCKMEIGLRESM